MGHAISRTKPSIVALDLFAREPSIDVFCGGWSAATIDATPQPASMQRPRIRFIHSPCQSRQSRSSAIFSWCSAKTSLNRRQVVLRNSTFRRRMLCRPVTRRQPVCHRVSRVRESRSDAWYDFRSWKKRSCRTAAFTIQATTAACSELRSFIRTGANIAFTPLRVRRAIPFNGSLNWPPGPVGELSMPEARPQPHNRRCVPRA